MAEIKERYSKTKKRFTYTVSIRIKGCPPVNKTFDRKTDAVEWAKQTETDIKRGIYFKDYEANKHTVEELIDRYIKYELPKRNSDQEKFLLHLNWWKTKIGKYYLSSINTPLITEYKQVLENEPSKHVVRGNKTLSKATVNRYLSTLSIVFSFAVKDWGWMSENPVYNVRKETEDNSRVRFLKKEEISSLLRECKKSSYELYLVVLIALTTGARYNEIISLTWKDVDLVNNYFYFMNTKNGDNRGIAIPKRVQNELKEYSKIRNLKNKFLFPGNNPNKPCDRIKAFNNAVKRAGIEDFRFHDLRHTAASYLAMSGKTLLEIAEVLGHKTLQMVKRYSHLAQKHTADIVEDMNDKMLNDLSL